MPTCQAKVHANLHTICMCLYAYCITIIKCQLLQSVCITRSLEKCVYCGHGCYSITQAFHLNYTRSIAIMTLHKRMCHTMSHFSTVLCHAVVSVGGDLSGGPYPWICGSSAAVIITAAEDPRIETFCIQLKLILRSKLTNFHCIVTMQE